MDRFFILSHSIYIMGRTNINNNRGRTRSYAAANTEAYVCAGGGNDMISTGSGIGRPSSKPLWRQIASRAYIAPQGCQACVTACIGCEKLADTLSRHVAKGNTAQDALNFLLTTTEGAPLMDMKCVCIPEEYTPGSTAAISLCNPTNQPDIDANAFYTNLVYATYVHDHTGTPSVAAAGVGHAIDCGGCEGKRSGNVSMLPITGCPSTT